jgi:hypothetical protein
MARLDDQALDELQLTAAQIARDLGNDDPLSAAAADMLVYLEDITRHPLQRRHRTLALEAELHLLKAQELIALLVQELGASGAQD